MNLSVNIKKKYKDFVLSVNIESHDDSLGLLGASGSGKSMTLRCIAGLETPDQGYIRLNHRVLFDSGQGINLPPRDRNIGLFFQNYALFPHMTVKENIKIGMKDKVNVSHRLMRLLTMFSLEDLQNRYPRQLSGGEQQRVAMARLLAYEPELLLLDEPFSALDAHLKEKLLPELKMVLSDYGKDLILVSHSKRELYHFCDSIAVLDQGALVEFGSKNEIFTYPKRLSTARLMGCKNISRAKKVGEYELMALDWGLNIKTGKRIPDEMNFVGIFGNHLRLSKTSGSNFMPVTLIEVIEGLKEVNLIFQKKGYFNEKHRLYLTMSKADWDKHNIGGVEYLSFPEDKLLFLNE